MKHTLSLALAGLFCASTAQAFEVTGGSLSLGYSSFVGGNDATEANKLSLGSSIEMGLAQQFSVQGDFSLSKFGFTNLDASNVALHTIFHISDDTSAGAYIGQDRLEGEKLTYFGVEVGHQIGAFGTEAYLTRAKQGGGDGTVFGIKGEYALTEAALVGAKFDNLNVDGLDVSRFALTGEMDALPGLMLTGEVGQARVESFGSEAYVGVGVKVNFGAKRGATFDRRSIIDLVPGL